MITSASALDVWSLLGAAAGVLVAIVWIVCTTWMAREPMAELAKKPKPHKPTSMSGPTIEQGELIAEPDE